MNLNNIEFWAFNPYIHFYRYNGLHDILKSIFPIDYYTQEHNDSKERRRKELVANFELSPNEFPPLVDILNNIINEYYWIGKPISMSKVAVYYQTNLDNKSILHSHIHDSSITATTYIDPPEEGEGGELQLYTPTEGKINIQPSKDVIYFFPSWLLHRPLPQTRKEPRICLNLGFNTNIRPMHKLTADRW